MANFLTRFATSSQTSYAEGAGLRYTDQYWGSLNDQSGPSVHNTGFIPNTPISPIQMNTLFSQTTLTSYILGEVLASNVIKGKDNSSLITVDIDSTTSTESQDGSNSVDNDIVTPFINFLNRINDISGNGGTGTESVWRSRQIGYSDSSDYWSVDVSGNLIPSSSNKNISTNKITSFGNDSVSISLGSTITVSGTTSFNQTVNIMTGYNSIGLPGSSYSQSIGTILNNISTRLYQLGFRSGDIPIQNGRISLKRQGNYVLASVTSTGGGLTTDDLNPLLTLPVQYRPRYRFINRCGGYSVGLIINDRQPAVGFFDITIETDGRLFIGDLHYSLSTGSGYTYNRILIDLVEIGWEANPL